MNGFNWWLPPNISNQGAGVDTMLSALHWFMCALFLFWFVFYVMCIVKFRARPGHKATYEPIHAVWSKYLEIGVAIFEACILIFFSMPVWSRFKNAFPEPKDSTQVRIVAQQFAWNFWYPGPDGKFGKNSLDNISGSNPVGLVDGDPDGKDDFVVVNNLYFPNDKKVYAWVTSKDVIHSFGVPALRLKQDVIPGMNIPIWFDVNAGVTGDYDIACSQLCGNGHGKMRAVLHPMAADAYAKWIDGEEHDQHPELFATPTPAETPAASPVASPAKAAASPAKAAATPSASPAK